VRSPNIVDYEDPVQVHTGLASGATAVNATPSASRKRRLSDADAHPAPKRPRGLFVAPRPQAVSDPLPTSIAVTEASDFDAWFRRNFDVPDAVTLQEPDPLTPVEVELFKDWTYHDGDLSENEGAAAKGGRTTCVPPFTSLTFGAVAFPMTHQIELLESELQTITSRLIDLSSLPDLILDDSIEPIRSDPGVTATHEPSSLFSTTSSPGLFTLNSMDNGQTLIQSLPVYRILISISGKIIFSSPSSSPSDATSLSYDHFWDTVDLETLLPPYSLQLPVSDCQSIQPQDAAFPLFPHFEHTITDELWSRAAPSYSGATGFSHNAFFDNIMSQELPDVNSSLFASLAPLPAAVLGQAALQTAEKQAKLEKLRQYQEEIQRLEAELAL
jgi:C-terminal domain of homeodomain 1